MIYEITATIDYTQYLASEWPLKKIKAIYKQKADGDDIGWIMSHSELILGGAVGSYVYDLYFNDLAKVPVLSKQKFFRAVRDTLPVDMKNIRVGSSIKYGFYTPKGQVKIKSR